MKEIIMTIHILAASLWVGGMLFMVLVLSPYVRKLPGYVKHFQEVGKRYSLWGTVISLLILFLTGLYNMNVMGVPFPKVFSMDTAYAHTLSHKIYLFFLTVVVAVVHDYLLGLRAHKSEKLRKLSVVAGIINLILGITIVYLAAKLRFGG
jgi:putative copper export protein